MSAHQKNGYLLENIADFAQAAHYYLDSLQVWNDAPDPFHRKIKEHTGEQFPDQARKVVGGGDSWKRNIRSYKSVQRIGKIRLPLPAQLDWYHVLPNTPSAIQKITDENDLDHFHAVILTDGTST